MHRFGVNVLQPRERKHTLPLESDALLLDQLCLVFAEKPRYRPDAAIKLFPDLLQGPAADPQPPRLELFCAPSSGGSGELIPSSRITIPITIAVITASCRLLIADQAKTSRRNRGINRPAPAATHHRKSSASSR